MKETNLIVKNLQTTFNPGKENQVQVLKGIDIQIEQGQSVGIVGESGSGKSVSMKAIMNLLPANATVTMDEFIFEGKSYTPAELKKIKLPISMIFQDPMTSLNPLRTIGYHLGEVIQRFHHKNKKEARELALKELIKVGINNPEERLKQYPHELSGGMRQRVLIAMALAANPKLLIADEPTTALDVTIQAQILTLIKKLQLEENLSVILVTHDFGIVAGMCDYVKVMYQGEVVEEGTTEQIFYEPQHAYTKALLAAIPSGDKTRKLVSVQESMLASEAVGQEEVMSND